MGSVPSRRPFVSSSSSMQQVSRPAELRCVCVSTHAAHAAAVSPVARRRPLMRGPSCHPRCTDGQSLYAACLGGSPVGTVSATMTVTAVDPARLAEMRNAVRAFGDQPLSPGVVDKVVASLESYLNPALSAVGEGLHPAEEGARAVDIVVCADTQLLELPLEALAVFAKANSVARDFSAQLLVRRLAALGAANPDGPAGSNASTPKKGGGSKGGKASPTKKSERKGDKKGGATTPDGMEEEAGGMPLQTTPADGLLFILDSQAACNDLVGEQSPARLLEATELAHLPSAGQRQVIDGAETVAAAAEVVRRVSAASSFVAYEPASVVGTIGPTLWSTAPLDRCRLAVLLDRMVSPDAQSIADLRRNTQSAALSALETPLHTAALLSLRGVSSLSINHWSVSASDNRLRAVQLLPAIHKYGVGRAARLPALGLGSHDGTLLDERGSLVEGTTEPRDGEAAAERQALSTPSSADGARARPTASFAFGHVVYGCPNVQLA